MGALPLPPFTTPFRFKPGDLYVNGFSVLRMFPSLDIFLNNKVMFSSLHGNTLNINENTLKLQQILNSFVPKLHKKITIYGAAWSQ